MSRSLKALKILSASLISMGIVSASLFSVVHNSTKNIEEANATSHPSNFASYSYSGSYYDGISSTASEGTSGTLRTSLTTLIHPTTVPTYSSSGETHLSTVLQYADEDPTNSSNMIYLYTRDSVKKNAASSWNREHVWCQSLSNGNWGDTQGGTDVLHLRPTYNSVNSSRGNKPYGDNNKSGANYYDEYP